MRIVVCDCGSSLGLWSLAAVPTWVLRRLVDPELKADICPKNDQGAMAGLLKNVTNSIWHAFMALQQEQEAMVNKSKLKVLTANIASLFDLYGVEKGLEHFRSTPSLSFDHFKYYLMQEVFATVKHTISLAELRDYESKIEELCWLVCRQKYVVSANYPITDHLRFKLFRIFCMLGDLVLRNNRLSQCEVLLHATEATQIYQQIMTGMGLDCETDNTFDKLSDEAHPALSFMSFLQLFEFKDHPIEERTESLVETIEEMYQTYINDIIRKGYLLRRGYLLPTLKEYWFVLQPCELTFYKNANQRDLCGSIPLDPNCAVRPISFGSASRDKQLKFSLTSFERNFELAAPDHRSRLQWIAALQLAITYSMGKDGYQRDLAARRRKRRDLEQKRKDEQEMIRSKHLQEVESTKSQLEREKLARKAAECQARELEIVAQKDSRRVAELEDVKVTLERLLHEETLAKRDEEIVRSLQARVLAEEWEKREELEQLQEEQRIVLEQEREKRRQFEEVQKEREHRLREAECRLKQLEEEREKLDLELKQARTKIMQSEENKEALEARLQEQRLMVPPRDGERLRRALSFMHGSRERDFGIEQRAAAFAKNVSKSTITPALAQTTSITP